MVRRLRTSLGWVRPRAQKQRPGERPCSVRDSTPGMLKTLRMPRDRSRTDDEFGADLDPLWIQNARSARTSAPQRGAQIVRRAPSRTLVGPPALVPQRRFLGRLKSLARTTSGALLGPSHAITAPYAAGWRSHYGCVAARTALHGSVGLPVSGTASEVGRSAH